MKKIFSCLFAVSGLLPLLFSCSKNTTQEPTDVNGTKIFTYQGVVVGSSGYYTLTITTEGATATLVFDGVTYKLSVKQALKPGQNIDSLVLTDNPKTGVQIIYKFFNGSSATPSLGTARVVVPGHNTQNTIQMIYDYRSTPSIYNDDFFRMYEGSSTYTEGADFDEETYNVTVDALAKTFRAISRVTKSSNPLNIGYTETFTGTFSETTTTASFYENGGVTVLKKVARDLSFDDAGSGWSTHAYLKRVN